MIYPFNRIDINSDRLVTEITAALGFPPGNLASGDGMTHVSFGAELTQPQQAALQACVAAHVQVSQQEAIIASIARAAAWGEALILETAVANVMAGITQAGKTEACVIYFHKLTHCLETGSLYGAISEIDRLLVDISLDKLFLYPFVTNAKLLEAKNKIQAYLGI